MAGTSAQSFLRRLRLSIRTVCLHHIPLEGPGPFATSLDGHGVAFERDLVPKDGLPNDSGDLLVMMGGSMLVNGLGCKVFYEGPGTSLG